MIEASALMRADSGRWAAEATPPTARSAAVEFEAYLLGSMLRQSTRPLWGDTPLDGGSAGRTYRELFYDQVARIAAERNAFGLARLLGDSAPADGAGGAER